MQLVTITPDGALHTLQKRGGLNLQALGRVGIVRVSEILWQEEEQRWAVQFRQGPYADRLLTCDDVRDTLGDGEGGGSPALFPTYEEGVECEVAVVEAAQRTGATWWRVQA